MSAPADVLAAELAIHRLFAAYCHRCDDGEFDALVDLFQPDGEFVVGGDVARGRAELLEFFQVRQGRPQQRGRHVTVNVLVELDGDHASAVSDFVFFHGGADTVVPRIVGRYHDDLAQVDGVWRFVRREVRTMGAAS